MAQALPCGNGNSDSACSATLNDGNCFIKQLPGSAKDPDQNCSATSVDRDQSCGDCDDHHESDEHCSSSLKGGGADPDEMCGHAHVFGLDEDNNCSKSVPDVGCGVHNTSYAWTPNDPDQHCPAPAPDNLDCTNAQGVDTNCNAKTFPSTTSPDEKCGTSVGNVTDWDSACSLYDADESCGANNTEDEACGTFPGPIENDPDGYCPTAAQDDTDDPQNGPLNPWCPQKADPDYWNPPPPIRERFRNAQYSNLQARSRT